MLHSSLLVSPRLLLFFVAGHVLAGPGVPFDASAAPRVEHQIVEGGAAGEGRIESFTVPVQRSVAEDAAVADATLSAPIAMAALMNGEALGEQRVLVTPVNFTNDPSTPYLVSEYEDAILDETNPTSSASYFLEASYGRAFLSGSVAPWFSASYANTGCFVAGQAGTQQLIDEIDPLVDFSTVDRWIIAIPADPACPFAGISSLGKWEFVTDEGTVQMSRAIVTGISGVNSGVVTHELGHGMAGLQHSELIECGAASIASDCDYVAADAADVMGSANFHGHFTAPNKAALQWLNATDLVDVTGTGGTYLIEPFETTGPGTKAIRIPVARFVNDYQDAEAYYVSYRRPLGFDAAFSWLATDGATIHQDAPYFDRDEATGASGLVDAKPEVSTIHGDGNDALLEVGQTFTDTDLGITIETLGVVGSALEVRVTRTQYCGNGAIDPAFAAEQCDGTDLGGATCESIGRTSGALACTAGCTFDVAACGTPVCEPGHDFDLATGLCSASLLAVGEDSMGYFRNGSDLDQARNATFATLLVNSRGSLSTFQLQTTTGRTIIYRMLTPFDTSSLPDGATIDSATLDLKLDLFWDPLVNSRPDLGDQIVLVQQNDPEPLVRAREDFGRFDPVDSPVEGAPRVDVGDSLTDGDRFAFDLNAAGLSWIDDTGYTLLGLRTGYDVDDVEVLTEDVQFRAPIVPNDSGTAGPRLTVRYAPVPEPGVGMGLLIGGIGLAAWTGTRRRRRS